MPMVELVWWPGTEAFLADLENIIKPTVAHISSANGCLRICYGLEEEDKATFWMVVVWKSHAHHKAMMNSPDYALMVGRLKPYFTGELKMNHVEFMDDERPSFGAPVTEISFLTSANSSEAKDNEALRTFLEASIKGVGATWGQTQEEVTLKIAIVGWASTESYREDSAAADVNIETVHVKFQEVFTAQ